jgi:pyruvate dehydrogenase E1 component
VTSYTELRRDAQAAERWNMLHPTEPPRHSYVETLLAKEKGPFIAASDYVRAVSEQIAPWVPGGMYVLGTDGFGRSELRAPLRRHFEVDAESITVATLYQLAKAGTVDQKTVAEAIKTLNIDPEKIDPLKA